MARTARDRGGLRWSDRLNARLFPWLGPPPLGPFDQDPLPPTDVKACPLCGAPMGEHVIERSGGNVATRLLCPARVS
jgi:hypothetical protein